MPFLITPKWRAILVANLQIIGSGLLLILITHLDQGMIKWITPVFLAISFCLGIVLVVGVLQDNERKCRIWSVTHSIGLLIYIVDTVIEYAKNRPTISILYPILGVVIYCLFLYIVNAYMEKLVVTKEKQKVDKEQDVI